MTIQESTLVAPTFNGSDDEIAAATQAWSSLVSSFSYLNTLGYSGQAAMSPENKRAIFSALICHASSKLAELDNVTTPPVVATTPPSFSEPEVVAPEIAPTVDFSYAEEKKPEVKAENPMLKRMRELAGIAHANNRV